MQYNQSIRCSAMQYDLNSRCSPAIYIYILIKERYQTGPCQEIKYLQTYTGTEEGTLIPERSLLEVTRIFTELTE